MSQNPTSVKLRIDLLGGLAIFSADGRPVVLPTRKVQALLAYLAESVGQYHPREKLTALLWGDTPEARARQSFRQALASLRRAAGHPDTPIILTRNDMIALNPDAVMVDVAMLRSALVAGDPESLRKAATLWQGEFLEGLRVNEAPFEEWWVSQRAHLRSLVLEATFRLLHLQLDDPSPEVAIQTGARLLAIDPSQEHVHRTLMRLLAKHGRRAAALHQYHVLSSWLHKELDAEPEEETEQLYRELLRTSGGRQGPSAGSLPPTFFTGGRRRDEAPLAGRDTDMAQLRHALANMLDGGGRILVLRGEAGVGKSRLLEEFVSQASSQDVKILLGRGHETEQILPLRIWIETLRGGAAALDATLIQRLDSTVVARLAQIFPELLEAGGRPALISEQYGPLFEAMVELIQARAQEQPTVLILEDIHWADALSIRFLAFCGRRLSQSSVLIICSVRSEDAVAAPLMEQAIEELKGDGWAEEWAIQPLTETDARKLVFDLARPGTPSDLWDQIAGRIWALSEGNPFVICESVRTALDSSPEQWLRRSGIAPTVGDFIASRLDRLPDRQRQVIAVAAAIGREFSFALLTHAAHLDGPDAADAVEDLVRRQLLMVVGDRLDFSHARIRYVAYDRLLPQRRGLLHLAVGSALETIHDGDLDVVADQLGHHYSRAGDAAKATAYLARFADLASRAYALEDAYRALAQARITAAQLPTDEQDRWTLDLLLRQAFILSSMGRTPEVNALLEAHVDLAQRVDDPLLISEFHFRVALTCIYLGDKTRGRAAGEQALQEAVRSGASAAIGKALYVLSMNDYESGRPRNGIAVATRAVATLRDVPAARIWLGLSYWSLGLNCLVSGDLTAALDAAARADAIGEAAAWPRVRALAGHVTAWALATRGDCDEAIEVARRSLDHSRDPAVRAIVSGTLGLAYLERGDGAASVAILEPVIEQLRATPVRSSEARNMALLGEAWLLAGDARRGREAAGSALKIGQSEGMKFNIGLAQRAVGRIALATGDRATAARALTAALEAFNECDARFELARARVDRARLLVSAGDPCRATNDLSAAIEGFAAAGAPRHQASALSILRTLA